MWDDDEFWEFFSKLGWVVLGIITVGLALMYIVGLGYGLYEVSNK